VLSTYTQTSGNVPSCRDWILLITPSVVCFDNGIDAIKVSWMHHGAVGGIVHHAVRFKAMNVQRTELILRIQTNVSNVFGIVVQQNHVSPVFHAHARCKGNRVICDANQTGSDRFGVDVAIPTLRCDKRARGVDRGWLTKGEHVWIEIYKING